ncbi:MAG: hypothetical protein S0880_19920 [Actinomycetota bacterium]|nr:hypothetical protein [Actinomycetota bacterium]
MSDHHQHSRSDERPATGGRPGRDDADPRGQGFDVLLARRLQDTTRTLRLEPAGPDAAVARARQRRRRHTAAASCTAAVALLAGVVTMTAGDDTPPPQAVAASQGAGGAPTDLDLEWGVTEGGLFGVSDVARSPSGALYALTTEPGAHLDQGGGPLPQIVYRLGDDGTWEALRSDAVADFDDIAADGDLLYGIGTAPRDADTVAVLSTSDDGGRTWSAQPFGTGGSPPSNAVDWSTWASTSIESAGGETLALVTVTWFPDWDDVFDTYDAGTDWVDTTTEGGPTLWRDHDGHQEVVAQLPWDALGVDGPDVLDGMTTAYRSTDDGWAEVDLPIAPDRLVAAGDGFLLTSTTVTDPGPPAVPTVVGPTTTMAPGTTVAPTTVAPTTSAAPSTTAAPTTSAPGAAPSSSPVNVVTTGPGDAVVTSSDDAPRTVPVVEVEAFTSADGVSWRPVDLPSGTMAVHGSDTSMVAVVSSAAGDRSLRASHDGGATWQPVDLAATGLPEGAVISTVASGPLGTVVVASTGERLADHHLLASTDLRTWDVDALDDVFTDRVGDDGPVQPTAIVGNDRIALSITVGFELDAPTSTAIGVPRA